MRKKLQKRSFRSVWCISFPWLHYNVDKRTALCHICIKASYEGKFLTGSAFITRRLLIGRRLSAFKKHQSGDCHRDANEVRGFTYWKEASPALEEVGSQKLRGRTANFCDSASSNHHNSGGGGGDESIRPQLRALATRTPSLGRVGQGAWV